MSANNGENAIKTITTAAIADSESKDVVEITTTTKPEMAAAGGGVVAGIDVDIEAGKISKITVTDIETEKEKPKDTTTTTAMNNGSDMKSTTNANVSNGENNGNISAIVHVKTTTPTTTELLSAKQQEHMIMGDAATLQEQKTDKGKMEDAAALINFKMMFVVTQLCGLTMIILVGCWVGIHMGGVAGQATPSLEFNWHPLLMTIGLIFLYGNAILIYRGFRTTRKKTLKITHASIHMGAFILTVIALKTAFDSHNLAATPIPNMYSLHSWLGLSAVLIFSMQYVAGFMAYMVPGLKEQYKIAYMPLHIYFGLFGFVLAIASALMGFTEKAIFSIPGYSGLPNSGLMVNISGVLFVVFGGLVVYLCTEPAYKRKPIPEDAVLLTGANE